MDDNPYQSPESTSEVEKRPKKPHVQFVLAVVYGYSCIGAVMLLLTVLVEIALAQIGTERSLGDMLPMLLVYGIIAALVGTMIARRTLRAPESTWAFVVMTILAIVALTGVVFVTILP